MCGTLVTGSVDTDPVRTPDSAASCICPTGFVLFESECTPCPDGTEKGNAEVHSLWYKSDGEEHSAQLEGALIGEERKTFWDEQKAFYIVDEPEEEEEKEKEESESKRQKA